MRIEELPIDSDIYFIGIGGISMSAIALILSGRGYRISGYDRTVSGTTEKLITSGITVYSEFDPSQLDGITHAVFSAAFTGDHPIMQEISKRRIKLYSRAEILGAIADMYENSVAIAGTHGKSTTSGMIGHTFLGARGCDPTTVVGAVMRDVGSTYRIGSDSNFIFEACEYKDSFLSFFPHIAVVLNVSLDHTDYFPSLSAIKDSFTRFMNNTGEDGYAVYNIDCPNTVSAAKGYKGNHITFSANGNTRADYFAANIVMHGGYATFDVFRSGAFFVSLKLSAPGEYNVANALAAVSVCDISGISKEDIVRGIGSFVGVGRRFEYKGSYCGADVYDDYAHHPDEIKATLSAARQIAKSRVVCVFQPHNYSRLLDLYDEFVSAFDDADTLILCPLYAAREACGEEVSSKMLADDIKGAIYFETFEEIKTALTGILEDGDLLIIMGAGDITALANSI